MAGGLLLRWLDKVDAAALLRGQRQQVLGLTVNQLLDMEEQQAAVWLQKLVQQGCRHLAETLPQTPAKDLYGALYDGLEHLVEQRGQQLLQQLADRYTGEQVLALAQPWLFPETAANFGSRNRAGSIGHAGPFEQAGGRANSAAKRRRNAETGRGFYGQGAAAAQLFGRRYGRSGWRYGRHGVIHSSTCGGHCQSCHAGQCAGGKIGGVWRSGLRHQLRGCQRAVLAL